MSENFVDIMKRKRRQFDENEESESTSSSSSSGAEDSEDEARNYKKGGYHNVQIGEKLLHKYIVTRKLGRGHFSTVWEVKNKKDEAYAMKVQKSGKSYRGAAMEEIHIHDHMKRLDGPGKDNVSIMVDHGTFHGPFGKHPCMVFKAMDCDLMKIIERNKTLSLQQTSDIAYQTLLGVNFLHTVCDIVHSDIKPENVLVKESVDGNIYQIADLGTGCFVGDRENNYLQTSHYRSPEIILSYRKWGTEIDIWSLACMFFECITGNYLFDGDVEEDLIVCMVETLGMPPNKFIDKCKYRRKYFTRSYHFKFAHDMKPMPMDRVLIEEYDFSSEDAYSICRLLKPMLEFDPSHRWTAEQLLLLYANGASKLT